MHHHTVCHEADALHLLAAFEAATCSERACSAVRHLANSEGLNCSTCATTGSSDSASPVSNSLSITFLKYSMSAA